MDYEESDPGRTGPTGRRKWLRWLYLALAVVVVAAGVVGFMHWGAADANGADGEESASAQEGAQGKKNKKNGDDEEPEKAPVPVEVAAVETGSVSDYITSSANLVAEFQVRILSEVEGRVARLLADEGDVVRKGQVLASLVRDDAEIAHKKAVLKQTNARLAYERGKDLSERELISREDHDQFTMDYEIARQELAEAEWRLEKTTIRAPFAGTVSERMIQVGQNIRPADELFEITDSDPLIARIFLPERDVLGLEEGRDVKIAVNAAEGMVFGGRIRQISPVVDTATGTIKVTVEAIDAPPTVRPGSFVTINIVRETHPEARVIPREAVIRELQNAHVFVVEGDVASKREVTLGLEEGLVIEALSGLEIGEQVIVAGQGGLRDGAKVKILGVDADEAGSGEETDVAEVQAAD
jgi:membrane fusion protein (multidrug efflux system)